MPESEGHELVDGELVEVGMGSESSWIAGELLGLIRDFIREHRAGRVFPQETGMQVWPDRPNLVRKPDMMFVRRGRIGGGSPRGWLGVVPDLVVEVVSPGDRASELEQKLREYRDAGVPLIWILFPDTENARIYRADGSYAELNADGWLDGEDVLPGFSCSLRTLFDEAREEI